MGNFGYGQEGLTRNTRDLVWHGEGYGWSVYVRMPLSTRHFFVCFRVKDVCQPGQPFPPLSIICVLYFCIFGANAKIQNTNSNAKAQDCSRRILLLRYLFKSCVSATHVIRVDLSKESLQSLKARSVQQPSPSPTLRPWINALQCIGGLVILKKN